MHLKEETKEKIVELYKDYGSTAISKMLSVGETTVLRTLRDRGVIFKDQKSDLTDIEGIISLFKSSKNIKLVAKTYRCHPSRIKKILIENGFTIAKYKIPTSILDISSEIIKHYKEFGLNKTKSKYSITRCNIKSLLDQSNDNFFITFSCSNKI